MTFMNGMKVRCRARLDQDWLYIFSMENKIIEMTRLKGIVDMYAQESEGTEELPDKVLEGVNEKEAKRLTLIVGSTNHTTNNQQYQVAYLADLSADPQSFTKSVRELVMFPE